jgi:murein DD-endopeptidase MepM/ murein hydrolase activator NlpD
MLRTTIGVLCFISSFSSLALELKGSLTQGGMIIGQLDNPKSVSFNGKSLKVTEEGRFVFGFGRDAKTQHELSWIDSNGAEHKQDVLITTREYKIDRITGVEKKYVSPPDSVLARIKNDAQRVRSARAGNSDFTFFTDTVYRPAKGRISGVYGSQRFFNGKARNPHYGLDIANKTGSPVWAPLSGRVVMTDPDLYYSGGTVIIDHGHGVTSTYIHLDKIHVKVGELVKVGQHFADIGATGRVTGPHLDWRFNWFNERLDPALLMTDKLANTK